MVISFESVSATFLWMRGCEGTDATPLPKKPRQRRGLTASTTAPGILIIYA
jgi:hypothetical protein